ncbi:MAG TPA: hypothetical protein VHW64_04290 [Nocardioides sp.]|jgi:hypothetical protein|uniref:hypothetical protein n=1 Tax=Nocardioides sp. TaxID=35761 RepID=UPI002E3424F6|nr:hypothetical protein [Nocardioides sp.]HEX3929896.1 hypothetical protein [Nocardioides sp.]
MTISPRVRNSAAALVTLLGGLLALLAVGPTPTASAYFDGSIGSPGPYVVTPQAGHSSPPMIEALPDVKGAPFFTTTGVTVGPTAASRNSQTVTARYRLESWSDADPTWVPMQEYDVSKNVGPYNPDHDAASFVMGQHIFWYPTLSAGSTLYRVMYTISWEDSVTGAQLGYWDVYPDAVNNACALPKTPCKVWTEGIEIAPAT